MSTNPKSRLTALASILRQSKVVPTIRARTPREEKKVEPTLPAPEDTTSTSTGYVYGEPSDNWDVKYQPKVQELKKATKPFLDTPLEIIKKSEEDKANETRTIVQVKTVAEPVKKRYQTVSCAFSQEEMEIINAFKLTLDISWSAWMRQVIFDAIGKKLPPRPKKG